MSAESALFTRSFKVGRYTCTWTVPQVKPGQVQSLSCEWFPDLPKKLSASEIRKYRLRRNEVMAELATVIGGGVAAIEL